MYIPSWIDGKNLGECPVHGPGTVVEVVIGTRLSYPRNFLGGTPIHKTVTKRRCQARETADPQSRWCRWSPEDVQQEAA